MRDLFKDTNTSFEPYIEKLTPLEDQAFDRGFEAALLGVNAQIVDTKRRILDEMLGCANKESIKARCLLSQLALLDSIELELAKRIDILDAKVALLPED